MQSSQIDTNQRTGLDAAAVAELDRLILAARIQGVLDLRCVLTGPLTIEHHPEPEGIAAYHVVLAGACVLQTDGHDDVRLDAGDIVLLPRGQAHAIQLPGEGTVRPPVTTFNGTVLLRSNVNAKPAALDLLCGRFAYAHPAFLIDALPELIVVHAGDADVEQLIGIMRREAEKPAPGSQAIAGAISTALFAKIMRAWLSSAPQLAGVLALLSHERVGRAVLAMLNAPGQPWSIARLANTAAMSRASFMRAYASLSAESPLQSLARLRMQTAGRLLLDSRRKTGEIAAEVGYTSETAFTKKFKDVFAVTPKQFRLLHRDNHSTT